MKLISFHLHKTKTNYEHYYITIKQKTKETILRKYFRFYRRLFGCTLLLKNYKKSQQNNFISASTGQYLVPEPTSEVNDQTNISGRKVVDRRKNSTHYSKTNIILLVTLKLKKKFERI